MPQDFGISSIVVHELYFGAGGATVSSRAISHDHAYRELYRAFDGFERNTIANDDSAPALIAASIWEGFRAGAFRIVQ
jgi:hypothetical protein